MGPKLVYLWIFNVFACHFIFFFFIKIHEYAKWMTCTIYHRMKGRCIPPYFLRIVSVNSEGFANILKLNIKMTYIVVHNGIILL